MKEKYFMDYPDFQNVKELVYHVVHQYAKHNAFILKEQTKNNTTYKKITFEDFLDDVNCLGEYFYDVGYQDKKIGIIAGNSYEWFLVYITVLLGNMVVVPLDKGLKEFETENSLRKINVDILFYNDKAEEVVMNIKSRKNTPVQSFVPMDKNEKEGLYSFIEKGRKLRESGKNNFENAEIDSYKPSVLCATSGTSANSKVVMLSHRNIAFDMCTMHHTEEVYPTDVNLAFIPMHHTFGCNGTLFIFSYGACTAFPDGLRYISQNLKEYGISVFIGVPLLIETMYKKIIKEIEKQGKMKQVNFMRKIIKPRGLKRKVFKSIIDALGGKMRFIVSGAAPLDKEVWKFFNDIGIIIVQGYGLTETSPVISGENTKFLREGSVGQVMFMEDVKIVDKNELGIGEISVKGDNVMLGYYENEDATKEVFRDGYFLTGDLGYLDKDGFLFITGRKKNVIIAKNGKNIYPEEIEAIINKLPEVKESMVYALPKDDDIIVSVKVQYDKDYVDRIYVGKDIETVKDIVWEKIKEINKTFPTYKHIKNMIFTKDDFIKTTTAKIKRFEEIEKIKEDK